MHSRSHMHPKCHMALNKNSGIMTTRVYSSELPPTQSRYRGAGCKAANAVPTQGYICVSLLKCHQRRPAPRVGFFLKCRQYCPARRVSVSFKCRQHRPATRVVGCLDTRTVFLIQASISTHVVHSVASIAIPPTNPLFVIFLHERWTVSQHIRIGYLLH